MANGRGYINISFELVTIFNWIFIYFTIWHMYFIDRTKDKTTTNTFLRLSSQMQWVQFTTWICIRNNSNHNNGTNNNKHLQLSSATTFDTVHVTIIAWPRLVFYFFLVPCADRKVNNSFLFDEENPIRYGMHTVGQHATTKKRTFMNYDM